MLISVAGCGIEIGKFYIAQRPFSLMRAVTAWANYNSEIDRVTGMGTCCATLPSITLPVKWFVFALGYSQVSFYVPCCLCAVPALTGYRSERHYRVTATRSGSMLWLAKAYV